MDALLTSMPAALWVGAVLSLAWNKWTKPALAARMIRNYLLENEEWLAEKLRLHSAECTQCAEDDRDGAVSSENDAEQLENDANTTAAQF